MFTFKLFNSSYNIKFIKKIIIKHPLGTYTLKKDDVPRKRCIFVEKIISPEERIKRAEEIYYRRRQNSNVRMPSSQVTQSRERPRLELYKKMALQILICILIYLIFSLIKDANYLFSEDIMNKTKEFLSQDINFTAISEQVSQFWQENQDKFSILMQNENNENEEKQEENQEQQNAQNEEQNEQNANQENKNGNTETENKEVINQAQTNNQVTGIGGAKTNEETVATSSTSSSKKTQMELDAEYIKANFSLTLPAKAPITSRYGKREATKIISANHLGIDIGVVVGTSIVAAMDGKVSVVSTKGDYGTHVKIVNKDVTTIYAHCSKILVREGATVKKGQKIALSGNTGNTTGPHLHFEIRRDERTVDPELVLNWS